MKPAEKFTWNGFRAESFEFEGRKAILVFPNFPDEKKNWMLKAEYWDAFPQREIDLINRGFHLAYLQNETRWATQSDCDCKARFCEFLSQHYGLRDACVPVGFSCGGAHAVNFAGYHPENVICLFLDAPVLNFVSIPGKLGNERQERIWDTEFTAAYPGISRTDLFCFPDHPINQVKTLLEHRIPIAMLYGSQDASQSDNFPKKSTIHCPADTVKSSFHFQYAQLYQHDGSPYRER